MKHFLFIFLLCHIGIWLNAQHNQILDETLQIKVCDNDFDGIYTFQLENIQQQILSGLNEEGQEDVVYISASNGGVKKVENVSTSPTLVNVCPSNFSLYEIAINQQQEIFVSSSNGIYAFNEDNCQYNYIGNLPDNSRISMSFDTQNNLYVGGFHSKIYRADAGQFTNFYEWENLEVGSSGGDFVVIGDFMYIAWTINDDYFLYKVTLGTNNEFISYENLGLIEYETYGLAAENGKLYGVTPRYLYEIDLETMQTTNVIDNPYASDWWGAAGLHEAIEYEVTFHENLDDAQQGENSLDTSFTNTTPFLQQIFIRVYNETTGETTIYPLNLIVHTAPESTPGILNECSANGQNPNFNLETAISQMLTDTAGINFQFYETEQDAENEENAIPNPTTYTPQNVPATVYVVFDNGDCSAINNITLNSQTETLNLPTSLSFCEGDELLIDASGNFDSYLWTGLQGVDIQNNDETSASITITLPGTYEITVEYGTGCSLTQEIVVTQEALPSFQDETTYPICSDNNPVEIAISDIISTLNVANNNLYYELYLNTDDAENGQNILSNEQEFTNNQVVIIKVKNDANSDCYTLKNLTIQIHENPMVALQENYTICDGETLDFILTNDFSYQWQGFQGEDATNNNPESNTVSITQSGGYSVEVSNAFCTQTYQFEIVYSTSSIITSVDVQGNTITIVSNGTSTAEYSIDGENWYDSPVFNDVENGIYTAYVRDENLCGIATREFVLFEMTNIITPNGDGYNDVWQVKGLQNYPDSVVQIFDRYGKEILNKTIDAEFSWNGTYSGRLVSTGTYWYIIQVSDGRKITGYITVKNY